MKRQCKCSFLVKQHSIIKLFDNIVIFFNFVLKYVGMENFIYTTCKLIRLSDILLRALFLEFYRVISM